MYGLALAAGGVMFCGARYGARLKAGISGSLVPALSDRGFACLPLPSLVGFGERK
jgi:hypothetical protein